MIARNDRERHGGDAYDTAAAWAAEARRGLSERRRIELEAWLEADPDHARAFEAAHGVDDVLAFHAADPDLLALRQAALKARPGPSTPFTARAALIAAGVAVLAVGAVFGVRELGPVHPSPGVVQTTSRYATEVGERSTVTLPDGSTMTLNTASVAEVAYSEGERRVRLLSGQALFTVAHGQAAPFRVQAGDRIITATGTRFDVRLDGAVVRVALVEGGVRVAPLAAGARPGAEEALEAGEVLTAAPDRPVRVRAEDIEAATSWRDGLAVFDDTPLDQAVAEINRYAARPIVVAGERVGRHRVSGAFRTGEPERFAQTMTDLFPLHMERSADGTIILSERRP